MAATAKPKLKRLAKTYDRSSVYRPGRMVKMLVPFCEECMQDSNNAKQGPVGWWDRCPHDPYIERVYQDKPGEPITEELPNGDLKIVGYGEPMKILRVLPRFAQVPLGIRIHSGRGVQWAQAYGYKFPGELGYAPFCEYRDCWKQDLAVHSRQWGNYCSVLHCKLVAIDEMGIIITDDQMRVSNSENQQIRDEVMSAIDIS